ncbi:MAG: hypothetical protein IPM42_02435 [Saprospiraceae bacterium]|nr:hypothetical protein [Saprospiraceae bacterium]
MKYSKLCLIVFLVSGYYNSFGQVSTNSASGLNANYPTLAAAITSLNAATITGSVVITVNASETAPSGGYVITAQGSVANTITIDGNNFAIIGSQSNSPGSFTDAIFKLVGADYITIENFILQENILATNITPATNTVTEWGIALFAESVTNGSQNNIIQNNVISLRVSALDRNTIGIYSNVNHLATSIAARGSITAFSGTNSDNKIYGNTISKVSRGIVFSGNLSATNHDQNNEIGGSTPSSGNIIKEWGHSNSAVSYSGGESEKVAISSNRQINESISNNIITSNFMTSNTNGQTIIAIYKGGTSYNPTATTTISNNTITLKGLDHNLFGIYCFGSSYNGLTLNITGNKLLKWTLNENSSGWGINGILNVMSANTLNVTDNLIRGLTTQQTFGNFSMIINQGSVINAININNNQFGNDEGPLVNFNGITSIANLIDNSNGVSTCSLSISGNEFNGITYTNPTSHSLRFINISSTSSPIPVRNISQNVFKNMNLNMTGPVTFFNLSSNIPANGILALNNNSIQGNFIKSGASGDIKIIDTGSGFSAGANAVVTIDSNNFSNITSEGTSTFNGITYNLGQSFTATGNTFSNLSLGGSNSSGNYAFSVTAASIVNMSDNIISNINTPFAFFGINNTQTGTSSILNNNQIFNITSGTNNSGILYGGSHNFVEIINNTINDLTATNGNVTAINCTVNSGATVASIAKNKISNLIGNGATNLIKGLTIGVSSTNNLQCTVSNNIIGDLKAPNANIDNAIRVVEMATNGATIDVNFYYNTIYLNATSTGPTFGSSIFTTNGFARLDLRNNIFVNNSTPNGAGLNVVFKNLSITAANYKPNSGNNLLYAGVPDAQRLIYSSGVIADQTLQSFQARVYPRDSRSVTELPSFLSLDGTSSNYLHLDTALPTKAENGGVHIPGFATDFDNVIRAGNPGYLGSGSLPDIGADEGDFAILDVTGPLISFTNLSTTASLANRNFNNVSITDVSGINNTAGFKPRVYYKKKNQANTFIDNTNTTDGWKYMEATGNTSPFDFVLDYSLLYGGSAVIGDTIQYFVLAQDLAPTPNVGLVSGILAAIPLSVNLDVSHFPLINAINFYAIKAGNEGAKTVCPSGCDYSSLTNDGGIFEAINNSLVTDNLTIQITDDLTAELGTHPLNEFNAGKTILIRPVGGVKRTISGTAANGKPLIDLNGADFVTIDGINTGGDSLTISNLSVSSTTGTSTIRFTNAAANNTLINCRILGSSTVSLSSYGSVILFNNNILGNNNNSINHCDIGPAGINLPVVLISSNSTHHVSGNSISNCNLFDFFSATKSSAGIYLENNIGVGTNWNISGNRFFQTTPKTITTTGSINHSCINMFGGDGHTIQNNIVGYANALGTGIYSIIGVSGSSVSGLILGSGTNTYSSIQGNKISNLSFTGTTLGSMTLMSVSGLANVGTIIPNEFGDTLTNANIIYTTNSNSTGTLNGLSINQSFTNTSVKNNIFGGIQASNIGSSGCNFNAIICSNEAKAYISENIIGGNTINSLHCTSSSTSSMKGVFNSLGNFVNISNNIIRNLSSTSNASSNVYGIELNTNSYSHTVDRNKIFMLSGLGSAGFGNIYGVTINPSSSGSTSIEANFIHTLNTEASGNLIAGINIVNGLNKVSNNIIRLGLKEDSSPITLPCSIYGIYETAGNSRLYHNTVLIAGINVEVGVAPTAALRRVLASGDEIRNNIFSNIRSNNTTGGSHYNIYVDATTITPIVNNNLYFNSSDSYSFLGRRGNTNFTSLSTWSATTGKDANSFSEDPSFILPLGNSTNLDLHILKDRNSASNNNGSPIIEVNTDFDGDVRSATTPDIGADEGDFVALNISYTPLTNTKITPNCSLENVNIIAPNSVNNTAGFKPKIYFKKTTDANDLTGWKFTETTSVASPYSFHIDYSLLNIPSITIADTIQYFVAAQDLSMPSRAAIESGLTNAATTEVNLNASHFPILGNINNFIFLDTMIGNYTVCNSGCDFESLTNEGGLFSVINARLVTGNIVVSILSDLTSESGTHSLNQFTPGFTLSIVPTGGVLRTISGTVSAKGLIALAGADNVTIDGLNTGGNGFTISNLSTSNTSYTSTIEMRSDASNNLVKNCTVLGSSTGSTTNCGVIIITYANIITGNDNNIIRKCNVGPAGSNHPTTGIIVNGISGTTVNDNNVIDSNIIFDYFSATITSSGIQLGSLVSNTTITNNKFYQSVPRTQTGFNTHYAINVNNSGFSTISDNIIGGSDSNNNGMYEIGATNASSKFYPIYISASTLDTTKVNTNIIKNLLVNGNRSGTGSSTPFTCINVNSGLVQINNNTIGDMQGTASISYTSSSTSAGQIYGIRSISQESITTNLNKIGGISITNSSTGAAHFLGLSVGNVSFGKTWICLNNTIGGTHPQSIQSNGTNTGTMFQGINASGLNNSVNNVVSNNTIKNMFRLNLTAGVSLFSGIWVGAVGTITDNKIYNLASGSVTGTGQISGIYLGQTSTQTTNLERNSVHSFSTINPSCELLGIYVATGTYNVINNVIRLGVTPDGTSVSVPSMVTGIQENGTTVGNYYHNTVYIGGAVTGTGSSRCYFTNKAVASGIFRNNIFQNTRSNSVAGGHHTVFTTSSNVTINTDNNLYHTSGTDGKMALIVATPRLNLDAWRNANLRDKASIYSIPNLLNPDGDTSNFGLNINPVLVSPAEGSGVFAGNVTKDILGQTRSSLTPHDIGAYAGNFIGGDFISPEINFTDLSNDVVQPNRIFSNVTISDITGVETSSGLKPRLYFKKSTDANNESGWKFVEANNNTSPFNFTIDYSLLNAGSVQANDIIQYFVIASDIAAVPNVGKKDAIFAISPTDVVLGASHFPISGTLKSYTIKADIMGTKTVCTSGCDFNSLTNAGGAFEFINNNIVVGNVQLNITSDLATETGNVALNEFSSSFTLTIRPSGGPRVITNTSINNFITIDGADNVIIDGSLSSTNNTLCPLSKASRDLTIKNVNVNFNNSVVFIKNTTNNPAINNIVRNCNIEGNATSKTTYGISSVSYPDFGGNSNNANQFINNQVTKVQIGIYSAGQSIFNKNEGTIIQLNEINLSAPENLNIAGIYVGFENNANIIGNNISNVNSVTGSVSGIALGIIPSNTVIDFTGEEVTNTLISDNKINDITIQGDGSAYGITIASVISNGNSMNELRNNLLYNIKTTVATTNDFIAGILVGGGGNGITKIFHNTIRLTGVASFSAPSFCLVIGGNNPQLNVKNNIFVNEMTSSLGNNYTIGFTYDNSFLGFQSNRNNFYTAGPPFAVKGGLNNTPSGDIIDFAAYITAIGKDVNSKNILPVFVSPTDLHLTQDPINLSNLDAKGDAVGILKDIDCEDRSLTTPDIGADEIIGCNYSEITLVSADVNPIPCSGNTTNLSVNGNLNAASDWKWYSGSCGGTLIGSGSGIAVSPQASTTYYVRGEGGCVSESDCQSVTITIAGDVVVNTNSSGPGSLRTAISCAGDGDIITFDPGVLGLQDTIFINSTGLDINKSIIINQTPSTIVKIKTTEPISIFNILSGKTLSLNYVHLFLNPVSPNVSGRAILNNGNIQMSHVNISERSQNLSGNGSTIQNESGSSVNISSSNQIIIQN